MIMAVKALLNTGFSLNQKLEHEDEEIVCA